MNISGGPYNTVGSNQTDQPFLNILKSNGNWGITNGNACSPILADYGNMAVDANGFPTTMVLSGTSGCSATEFTLTTNSLPSANYDGSPTYSTGTYVLKYNGVGTATVDGSCSFVESGGTGRDIYRCAPTSPSGSIKLHIAAINAGNHIRDFALVYSPGSTGGSGGNVVGANEALLNGGEVWNPQFIARIKPFAALRFMDAFSILANPTANWADRTPLGYYSYTLDPSIYSNPNSIKFVGLPPEAAIALCNEVMADCWLNIPLEYTSSAITSFATLAHTTLNPKLRAIVEYGNEFFNSGFPPNNGAFASWLASYMQTQSGITGAGSMINQGIVGSVAVNDSWLAVYGADAPARLVRVLGGQSGFQGRNQDIMAYTLPGQFSGTAASHANYFATAPYWDFVKTGFPIAWSADADPYDKFMKQTNGTLQIPATTSGNCATAGTSLHYTASSNTANCGVNGSIPATPANGTFVVVNLNQPSAMATFTASVSGSVLTVSSVPTSPLFVGAAIGQASSNIAIAHILSLGTGTGSTGTYNLDNSPGTIGSQGFVAVVADLAIDGGTPYLMTFGDGENWDGNFNFQGWPSPQNTILSGTYNSGTGAVSLTLSASPQLGTHPGNNVIISGATGTGSFSSINGTAVKATAGTNGNNVLNFTVATGLAMTITGGTVTSAQQMFCFTQANIGGVVIPTWRRAFGDANDLGTMPLGVLYYTQNYSDATNAGLGLIGYESGQNFAPGTDPTRQAWFYGAMRDARMGVIETSYLTQIKSVSHGALTLQYNQISNFNQFGMWGAMEGVLQPGSPRYNAMQNFN